FHDTYVKDRYRLGLRAWFEQSNPTALAQVAERMLEAIRKDYWKADEQTRRELVQVYQEVAAKHDVFTANEAFKAYVKTLAQGFGLAGQAPAARASAPSAAPKPMAARPPDEPREPPSAPEPPTVRGQTLHEVRHDATVRQLIWIYGWIAAGIVLAGMLFQAWRMRRAARLTPPVATKAPS